MTALSVAKDCRMIKPGEKIYVIKGSVGNDDAERPQLSVELCRDVGATPDSTETLGSDDDYPVR